MKTKATVKPIKKMAEGGMAESECAGWPKKPGCRKKFKSKGKSQETKGGILGTLGAIGAGIAAGYGIKKLREQKKGGPVKKYQAGGGASIVAAMKKGGMTKRKK